MTVILHARNGGEEFRLNNLQVALIASALIAVSAPDRELWAPDAYVPSQVCASWSDRLFPNLSDLVLIEVWDAQRALLRPRGIVLVRGEFPIAENQVRQFPASTDPRGQGEGIARIVQAVALHDGGEARGACAGQIRGAIPGFKEATA